jgi:hypothetical protein
MPTRTSEQSGRENELEWLLDEIECGTIEDVDELDEEDVKLLRAYYGETENLQDLLDQLREDSRFAR